MSKKKKVKTYRGSHGDCRVHGHGYRWENLGGGKYPYRSGKFTKQTKKEFLTIPFGKHRGKSVVDVARTDPSYIRWWIEKCEWASEKKPACFIWAYKNILGH
jgi:hypothetical protein